LKEVAMDFPADYEERVYAGVLGKIIGVYMGRPVENWNYERIAAELGDIWYYVHDRFGLPLVLTDDDIAGTFTFLRAIEDIEAGREPTAADIARAWLDYVIEGRSVFWWGGKGVSTEHTAYLALKEGVLPPESGSAERNGRIASEQIGAEIFIDGWGMVAPGDPALAARLAERAARVSHDGEAVHAAAALAAMESLAFVERDTRAVLDRALSFVPRDSELATMDRGLLELREREKDWRSAWEEFRATYNYKSCGGVCPVLPNHGLLLLGILYGDDDFQKTQMIVNSCGWDTDCNAGNAGCFMGIKLGLAGLDAGPDFRGPVRDLMYLSAADGGRSVTDALRTSYFVVNSGRRLRSLPPLRPKGGARFHFDLPGAVQGFRAEPAPGEAPAPILENRAEPSSAGRRVLSCLYRNLGRGQSIRLRTPSFIPLEARRMPGYAFVASPTLHSGQRIAARLRLKDGTEGQEAALFVQVNGEDEGLRRISGERRALPPGEWRELDLVVPETAGQPVVYAGVELFAPRGGGRGELQLDWMDFRGTPDWRALPETKPGGKEWLRSWVDAMDQVDAVWCPGIRVGKVRGLGLFYQGTEDWSEYRISSRIVPHLFASGGLALGVRSLGSFLSLELSPPGEILIVDRRRGERRVLASSPMAFSWEEPIELSLSCAKGRVDASARGRPVLSAEVDAASGSGAAGLFVDSGSLSCLDMRIEPAGR
jgi:ADP-ribosylglycohydrolase